MNFLNIFNKKSTVEIPTTYEKAVGNIFPRISKRINFEYLSLKTPPPPNNAPIDARNYEIPHSIFCDNLGIELVYNLPKTTTHITSQMLADWGVTFAEVLPVALENLSRISKSKFEKHSDGIWISAYHDSFDCSRLLVPAFFNQLELKGAPVAFLFNHSSLSIIGSEDTEAFFRIFDLQKSQEDTLSRLPIVFDGKNWAPFTVAKSHPLDKSLSNLKIAELNDLYTEQKHWLDKSNQNNIFFASYLATEKEDGSYSSNATWFKDHPISLPRTERLTFIDGDSPESQIIGCYNWDKIILHCNNLMQDSGTYPQRFIVNEFPSESQLAAISQ